MIDLEFVERLIRTLDDSGLDHVEIERGGTRVRVSKSPPVIQGGTEAAVETSGHPSAKEPATEPAAPSGSDPKAAPSAAPDSSLKEVTSPMVGTFYRASSPGADPFVSVGDHVGLGDTLGIIEAMKLMNELEAEIGGTIREVCVENGEPVEFGQVLFRVQVD